MMDQSPDGATLGYEIAPWVSLVFPAWVAVSSVLIVARRRSHQIVDGA